MANLASLTLNVKKLFCYAGCCRQEPLNGVLSYLLGEGSYQSRDEIFLQGLKDGGLKIRIVGLVERLGDRDIDILANEDARWIVEHPNFSTEWEGSTT